MVTMAIIGLGPRGRAYASFSKQYPDKLKITAIAEPIDSLRAKIRQEYDIPEDRCFRTWQEMLKLPKLSDAVAICTQDHFHEEPAIACARAGYDILLEKPMAPTADACRRIVAEVKKAGVIFSVCHVLRYTPYTYELQRIIDSGEIGDIVTIHHLEPVNYYHYAHSYVRGNWHNEAKSSFMLLAKCCHDVDWIHGIMKKKCVKIHSFGALTHFTAANRPAGAADRCLDCPHTVESLCPYSAVKIYLRDRFCIGNNVFPLTVISREPTLEIIEKALRETDYGKCVYHCDNDVVDNQVVNMLFEDGTTANMTMIAFTNKGGRRTTICGTRGEIITDSKLITIRHFLDNSTREVDTNVINDGGIASGHGGGDFGLTRAFVDAVEHHDQSRLVTGIDETLESHLMVFAAEESRRQNKVCDVVF